MTNRKVIRIRDGETINSVVRRLRNTVEPVVHLVSDGADSLFANIVNLRLIHYYAAQDNKTVIIECNSPEVRKMCAAIGLGLAGDDVGDGGADDDNDTSANAIYDTSAAAATEMEPAKVPGSAL
ncbi:MAG TPA: hypothetical protein DCY84_08015, partial [Firmicutes bacterium]|nr:hypothetical protein [Bacillota bacterium]